MALPHAQLLDVINVSPLGARLPGSASSSLLKTDRLQLLHLVLAAHQSQPEHHVDDECTLHCLEGEVEVQMPGGLRHLRPGELLALPARQPHALKARSDAALLVTLVLRDGDAGDGGGSSRHRPG
ncbi:MAG TPA: cupin domain-containing protein [Ideonella sp.]|uniref:cupin domain-containing protein n=1 Tax=Ideonella sp. TaxID=1929293 RepID=UPI002CB1055B|nr:cupin domain-containing protein [Ideonella sp.]HSI49462.1 cupin domain-containing protein [Ideonella sp.]